MKDERLSVTTQAVIAISTLLLVVNILLGSVLLSRSKMLIKTLLNERMLDIANTSAAMLDGDALAKLTEDSIGSPAFQDCFDTLKVFQDNIDLEYIYTVRDMGDGTFIFLVDPAEENPGEYGAQVMVTDALRSAARGTAAVDDVPYEDAWGKFYSAYSPVLDSHGAVGGIVCVDFRAEWYEHQLARYANVVLLFSVLSLFVGAGVVLLVTGRVRGRLRALDSEMGALTGDVDELLREIGVTAGDETVDGSHTGDEMAAFSRRIHAMRSGLRQYIDHMHAQANGMITAMAADYRSVYYVDLDRDEGICYRAHAGVDDGLAEGEQFSFREKFTDYAQRYVAEGFREEFLRLITPEHIRQELEHEPIVAHRYLVVRGGSESYEMLRMAGVRRPEDRSDHLIHAVAVGFTDVDRETRETLAQQQALSDALAQAEAANAAKTSFLNSMSHEIRTPMNAIIGLNSLALRDGALPPHAREHLEKIDGSAKHLLSLINDILDMSRIESGRINIRSEAFFLSDMLAQINTMIGGQCREKGLEYEFRIADGVAVRYIGDDTKLKQILLNILGNAVKFTPAPGTVAFHVEPVAQYAGNTTVRFTVRDTGIGMDPSFLPRIFDTFSQENEKQANKYGSTGLGMAITKNLVEMMNGRIEVESQKGVGSTFTVTLTMKEADAAPSDAAPEPVADAKTEERSAELFGKHVLLAEDMEINAEIMVELLGMRGVTADHAENGQDAVDRFSWSVPGTYDAVLMDVRMPVLDGLGAAEAIRALDRPDAKTVPIIAMTANAFEEDVQRSLQAGMNAHLSKPVEPERLFETLEKLICGA